jgi:uncharacterized repeat protein (TIGR01451 family)
LTISASNGGPWNDFLSIAVHKREPDSDAARILLVKTVEPAVVSAGGLLTFTISRSLWLTGTHTYAETLIDPIPAGTLYVTDSFALDGVPVTGAYSPTANSIYLAQGDTFTESHEMTLTFQVQVNEALSTISNVVTGTVSIDGGTQHPAYTATASASGCSLPAAPVLVTPADGAKTRDQTPEFTWEPVDGADEYFVQVDDDAGFVSPIVEDTVAATSFLPATELDVGAYFWRVRASNLCDVGMWSPAWKVVVILTEGNKVYLPIVLRSAR